MIKAIIFDYFGVICSDEYWRLVKEDKNLGGSFHDLSNAVNAGTMPWQEFIDIVAQKTSIEPDRVKVLFETAKINPELLAYITKLKDTHQIGLLTNGHYEFLEPRIKEMHLDRLFDVIVISSRVGMIKPYAKIYTHILDKMGVKASEAVLIDDIERNVTAAETIDMKAILYRNFRQMKEELEKLIK